MDDTPFPARRTAPRLRALLTAELLRPLPPSPQSTVLLIVGETGSGDMKHGKSRLPASFPGEK